MEPSHYHNLTVKRGLKYHYYFSPSRTSEPTLLFVHGFPSTSYDWRRVIAHFQPQGYGILAPDLLGYGGTDKPLDAAAFGLNRMAGDLVDILDHHGIQKAVGIGHDWGCVLLSRLSVLYQDRFHAFAWLGGVLIEPHTKLVDLDTINDIMERVLGYRVYSYIEFFGQAESAPIIDDHIDSFIQLLYPDDPSTWRMYMCTKGKTAECIDGNIKLGKPSYMSNEDYEMTRKNILDNGGIRSALNWYISTVENAEIEENAKIPGENYVIRVPAFFASVLKDCINAPPLGLPVMEKYGTQVTYEDFDCGHWLQLELPGRLNEKLKRWIDSLSLGV